MGKILLYIGNSDLRASLRIWLERIVEVDCLACFKITEQTLKNLKSEKVPEDEVLEKLTSIKVKDREFTVEKEFVEALTETIGKEQTNRFASSIFKYALSFPTDGDVDLVIADGTGPKERYGLAPFEELRRHFWENEFTRVAEYRKWAKPIIFISTEKIEDLCGEKDGKKLAAALDVDPKIGILDFDIWHHSLKLPASLSD
ncbi:MAG TPA: hypothetical protein EYP19_08405, partial [Desulfobacterales bacterium]|nr:hypothetical protein [Desulfobacterales bacterium]